MNKNSIKFLKANEFDKSYKIVQKITLGYTAIFIFIWQNLGLKFIMR